MSTQEILKEIWDQVGESIEMMSKEEANIIINNALLQKLAYEIAMKEYYKSCWNAALAPSLYKGINS